MYEFKRISRTDEKFSRIGRPVPPLEAGSNHGIVKLKDYLGRWVIILSHPTDFSPTWASEIAKFADSYSKLKELHCELIGVAVANDHSPLMWPRAVQEQFEEKIWFPVIFDSHREFSKALGMVKGESDAAGLSHTIYIIDEHQILRSIVYYDPHIPNTMEEVFRLVKFLQKTNACGIVTPDNWRPGDEWILTGPPQKKENGKVKPEMWYF